MSVYNAPLSSNLSAFRLTTRLDSFPLVSLTANEINDAYNIRKSYPIPEINKEDGSFGTSNGSIEYSSPYLFKIEFSLPEDSILPENSIFLGYKNDEEGKEKAYGIFQVVTPPNPNAVKADERYVRAISYDDLIPAYFDMELLVLQNLAANIGNFIDIENNSGTESRSANLRFNDNSAVAFMSTYDRETEETEG